MSDRIPVVDRARFLELLKAENIGTTVNFIPVHKHPYYRDDLGFRGEDFPVAERVYPSIFTLPIYPRMTDDDVHVVRGEPALRVLPVGLAHPAVVGGGAEPRPGERLRELGRPPSCRDVDDADTLLGLRAHALDGRAVLVVRLDRAHDLERDPGAREPADDHRGVVQV